MSMRHDAASERAVHPVDSEPRSSLLPLVGHGSSLKTIIQVKHLSYYTYSCFIQLEKIETFKALS